MRYVIEPTEEGKEKRVWSSLNRLAEKGLIIIVEKGDPIEEMKENLRKVTRAMQLLEKIGLDEEIMMAYLYDKTKVSKTNIKSILKEQKRFFDKIGVELA